MERGAKANHCFLHKTAYILLKDVVHKNGPDRVCPTQIFEHMHTHTSTYIYIIHTCMKQGSSDTFFFFFFIWARW